MNMCVACVWSVHTLYSSLHECEVYTCIHITHMYVHTWTIGNTYILYVLYVLSIVQYIQCIWNVLYSMTYIHIIEYQSLYKIN